MGILGGDNGEGLARKGGGQGQGQRQGQDDSQNLFHGWFLSLIHI